jgi:hypothetical protein
MFATTGLFVFKKFFLIFINISKKTNEKMNKDLLRMQKLAGLITESEFKKRLSLNENDEENDEAQRNELLAKLKGQHAKDVVKSGNFTRVSQFGSGEDESPRVNVMNKLSDELSYFKTPEDQDSDDYDELMLDLEAAEEIAAAVEELGGKVSYFSRSKEDGIDDLEFIYSVENGDLFGQTEIVPNEPKGMFGEPWDSDDFGRHLK